MWIRRIEHSRSARRSFVVSVSALGVLTLGQVSILAINHFRSHYPIIGLSLEHQRVSNLQDQELKARLPKLAAPYLDRQITITAASYQQHISPRQLGARVDEKSLLTYIVSQGHSGTLLDQIIAQDRALIGQNDLPLDFSVIDSGVATAYLSKVNQAIVKQPSDAHFAYQNNSIEIIPDQSGIELSIDQSLELLSKTNLSGRSTAVTLPVTKKAALIHTVDVQPFKAEFERIAAAPLTLSAGTAQTTLSPQQLVDITQVKLSPDPTKPTQTKPLLTFNEAAINTTLDQLAAQVNIGGSPRIVAGRTVLSQGQATVSLSGSEAKVTLLSELLKREYNKDTKQAQQATTIALPVQRVDPPIVNQYDVVNPLNNYPAQKPSIPSDSQSAQKSASSSRQNVVYLTFDDGPGGATEQTLDILKHYGIHSTFFLVGRNIASYPNTARRIIAEGHTIGNHSFNHTDLSRLSAPKIAEEIRRTQDAFTTVTNKTPVLFRPPYGAMNPETGTVIDQSGLHLMMWSVDPRDWSKPGSSVIADRVLSAIKPGSVILLHSINQQTTEALPSIIEGLRARGYLVQ